MKKNGFNNFGFHTYSKDAAKITKSLNDERAGFSAFALTDDSGGLSKLDPETAARQHLQLMVASTAVPQMEAPVLNEKACEFRSIGTETIPLTGTKTVKFRQTYDRTPVYGSLVTVELDEDNELLAVNSSIGSPEGVEGTAEISSVEAIETVSKDAGLKEPLKTTPQLNYYFDTENEKWHLVFMIEDVPQPTASKDDPQTQQALLMDYFVDANSGKIIAKRPRTPNANQSVVEQNILDGLGNPRSVRCMSSGNLRHLYDDLLNVHTYDFGFQDLDLKYEALPGNYATNPPNPWFDAAVSAHANATIVAEFLRNVLKRNGIDNLGGALISSVNCISGRYSPDGKQWNNAAWYRGQMVYGQKNINGNLRSYAVGIDVVAHEIFHGVTNHTARLEYAAQSGALNESYSDILGVIISNYEEKDISKWNWEMGEDLNQAGVPLRDFHYPTQYGQPAHMDDYQDLPMTPKGDWGGVHINSGIHNYAAYKIMTATNSQNKLLFTADLLAALFYLALTQYLTRNSEFPESRQALETVAQTLFRNDPINAKKAKLQAISDAFDAVGIV
jgi:Zn-dependent metalloprotease